MKNKFNQTPNHCLLWLAITFILYGTIYLGSMFITCILTCGAHLFAISILSTHEEEWAFSMLHNKKEKIKLELFLALSILLSLFEFYFVVYFNMEYHHPVRPVTFVEHLMSNYHYDISAPGGEIVGIIEMLLPFATLAAIIITIKEIKVLAKNKKEEFDYKNRITIKRIKERNQKNNIKSLQKEYENLFGEVTHHFKSYEKKICNEWFKILIFEQGETIVIFTAKYQYIIPFSKIIDSSINTYEKHSGNEGGENSTITTSLGDIAKRSVVGAVVAGPAGAVIGGMTAKKNISSKPLYNYDVVEPDTILSIIIDDLHLPILRLNFVGKKESAEKFNALLRIISQRFRDKNKEDKVTIKDVPLLQEAQPTLSDKEVLKLPFTEKEYNRFYWSLLKNVTLFGIGMVGLVALLILGYNKYRENLFNNYEYSEEFVGNTLIVTVDGEKLEFVEVECPDSGIWITLGDYHEIPGTEDYYNKHDSKLFTYYICKTEITNSFYNKVINYDTSQNYLNSDGEDGLPFKTYDKGAVSTFVRTLNEISGEKNGSFDICSGGQWQYAYSGGKFSKNFRFSGSNNVEEVGWIDGDLHPTAQKKPNELGIYDMDGNVGELTLEKGGCDLCDIEGSLSDFRNIIKGDISNYKEYSTNRFCSGYAGHNSNYKESGNSFGIRLVFCKKKNIEKYDILKKLVQDNEYKDSILIDGEYRIIKVNSRKENKSNKSFNYQNYSGAETASKYYYESGNGSGSYHDFSGDRTNTYKGSQEQLNDLQDIDAYAAEHPEFW